MHHLKILIDSHRAWIRVFQVDLKPVFAGGGESVDIFQANHSFTWRNCVLRNVIMVYLLIQSRLHIQQKSCGRIQSNKDATKWIDITISSCKSLNIPTNYRILSIHTVYVLIIKSIPKRQHAPPPIFWYEGSPSNTLFLKISAKYWMKFLRGQCIRGEVYLPVPLHFLDKKFSKGGSTSPLEEKIRNKVFEGHTK